VATATGTQFSEVVLLSIRVTVPPAFSIASRAEALTP
jgi:hypothetical protein